MKKVSKFCWKVRKIMSDNKKYYYMKLKETFFHRGDVAALESMKKGYAYSNLLLKMYLLSLPVEGRLMVGNLPHTPESLAKATGHKLMTVKRGLCLFERMGFIETLDNGAIYMNDMQDLVGQSDTDKERKERYKRRKDEEKKKIIKETEADYYVLQSAAKTGHENPSDWPPEIE